MLNNEKLLNALVKIQSDKKNTEALNSRGLASPEESAKEILSDKLVEELNKRMRPVYAANAANIFDPGSLSQKFERMNERAGRGYRVMPLVHDKEAAKVGCYTTEKRGIYDFSKCEMRVDTYIDSDGDVFLVIEHVIYSEDYNDGEPQLIHRNKVDNPHFHPMLNNIGYLLPEKYAGLYDGYPR